MDKLRILAILDANLERNGELLKSSQSLAGRKKAHRMVCRAHKFNKIRNLRHICERRGSRCAPEW
jgi:hypothetical protein